MGASVAYWVTLGRFPAACGLSAPMESAWAEGLWKAESWHGSRAIRAACVGSGTRNGAEGMPEARHGALVGSRQLVGGCCRRTARIRQIPFITHVGSAPDPAYQPAPCRRKGRQWTGLVADAHTGG